MTLLAVVQDGAGKISLLTAEGESVPGPTLGDRQHQQPLPFFHRRQGVYPPWCQAGPAHHAAIGLGHVAERIEKLGRLLGIKTTRVC